MSLGVLLAFTTTATFAYFADSATMPGATFTSGTLDLTVQAESDDNYIWEALTLADMVPGESRAASVELRNAGTVPFTYTATATGTGALLTGLEFRVFVGGTATNAPVGNLRTGSCGPDAQQVGGVVTFPNLSARVDMVAAANKQQIPNGANQVLCVLTSLPSTAGDSYQGTGASLTFTLDALQLGAPTP